MGSLTRLSFVEKRLTHRKASAEDRADRSIDSHCCLNELAEIKWRRLLASTFRSLSGLWQRQVNLQLANEAETLDARNELAKICAGT
jgi:hypothetical protein